MNIIDIFVYIFFVNPFELPYQSYDIRQELVDKPSMISYFPSTFCPTLATIRGGCITKVMELFYVHYYFVRMSVYTDALCSVFLFKFVSINSFSS